MGVHVFGSFRFEVNKADGDIDVVILVPGFVRRDVHFNCDLTRVLAAAPEVSDLQLITGTLVPLIKARISGIPFDILMANVHQDVLRDIELLNEHKYLSYMDEKSLRSVNGKIMSDYLVRNFKANESNFKTTLRCVKLWAKNRQIYSQLVGFLGGIGVTILVGKIAQLYPCFPPYKLLHRFFFIYSRWEWKDLPVLIEDASPEVLEQWKADRPEMMLVPPSYPCTNAAFNVTRSTLWAIRQ